MSAAFYISPPVSVSRRRWCAGVTYCYHGNTGGQVWLKRGSEFWISLDIFSELTSLYSGETVICSSPPSVFWTWRSPGYKSPENSSWWKVRRATSEGDCWGIYPQQDSRWWVPVWWHGDAGHQSQSERDNKSSAARRKLPLGVHVSVWVKV